MALSPNVVVVAPGELITAQHLNNVRSNLVNFDALIARLTADSGTVSTAGASGFTGNVVHRIVGQWVNVSVPLTRTAAISTAADVAVATLPAAARPGAYTIYGVGYVSGAPGSAYRVSIAGTGIITFYQVTCIASAIFNANFTYMLTTLP